MTLRDFYYTVKNKIKNFLGTKKQALTDEQRQYILSGINPEILRNYSIIYSPNHIYFKADKNGTNVSKGLEYKIASLDSRNLSFKERMKAIELNHLKKMNELYSSVVEVYNKGMSNLRDVFIYNMPDGALSVSFR